MAFYAFNGEGTPLGRILQTGLDNLRDGINKLSRINNCMTQMTDQQIVDAFGVAASGATTAAEQAASLKAEIASDVGNLLAATSVMAALNQMLAQTG